jgi:hypothetical protein
MMTKMQMSGMVYNRPRGAKSNTSRSIKPKLNLARMASSSEDDEGAVVISSPKKRKKHSTD